MSSYLWKVKALVGTGPIAKGMEVEIIIKNRTGPPSGNDIRDAFSKKYSINAPSGIYGNKHMFEIVQP